MNHQPYELGGVSLLLVEDENDARQMLTRMLAMRYPELRLLMAVNGAEGVAFFSEHRPDIVLADMNMPIMNGIQMAREIKSLSPDTTIIAVTAYNDPSYLMDAIEIGIRHYVLKPVNGHELFAVIDKSIEEITLKRLVREQDRKIRLNERQLSEAQKITHLGSWEWDITSGRNWWSDEMYRILGVEPGAIPAALAEFMKMLHPDDREAVEDLFKHSLKERQSFSNHYCRVVWPDGAVRILLVNGELTLDADGRPAAMIGTALDVTERRLAEEERMRLASIVESSNDAILGLDLNGTITSWNRGAETVYGYSAKEATGRHVSMIIPVEHQGEIEQIRETIVNGRDVMHFETVRIRKDGRRIYVSLTASPTRGLNGSVTGISAIARDVTERREMEELINYRAYHDTLTDLPNRQLFMDFLTLELAQARRNGKKLALLFLDLNDFKQINDTLGHDAGDQLLQEVARRLRACIRESDTVSRLGGDEFTVLMPDLGQTNDVGIVIRKILSVFMDPFMLNDIATASSTSIGISMFPDDGDSAEELIKKADIAMYEAKERGNNAYQFFNAEINARTLQRQELESFLRQAVERGEFELLFQPMVQSGTRRIMGAEMLLRWRHPHKGLLLPEQFLSVAEDTGAIVPIGEWALHSACSQMNVWNRKGYPLCLSVNLTRRQFHQPNLVEKTARILSETGLKPQLLEFEITEGTIMGDIDFSLRCMQQLTDMGINLAIDNFGTGSSSLRWIKKMPISAVKIDRSFIKNMLSAPDDLAVVNAAIAMSHCLRMKVVVNGVETESQLAAIRTSGYDEIQGYLISEPLFPGQFERLVARA
ncbi:EAL domain-containing protein [Geobacter sp. SVR]|uniref:EAL domain-containing protein n=1 Tax=Geobacter sp. SVR TaxID=2495594 RepID=UPI00143EFDB9|nr:EAL domain-containing protein [Geobacter sp. SVR]BCS55510.1 hypothetical protein GSVR_38180 [Geobacter sp. SVR]GCF83513.1 hypothetical protein GSbR_01130 [Geobacter sp. SVR]